MKSLLCYIDSMQRGGANRVMANLVEYFYAEGVKVTLVNDIASVPGIPDYEVSEGIRRRYLKTEKKGVFASNFDRIKKLRRIIREEQPEVVVSFLGPPNLRMLLATLGLPAKKVVSVRNDPTKEYGTGLRKAIANAFFCLADGVVFQTRDAAAYFIPPVRKKARIIYNPVNLRFYDRSWEPGGREILVVGRLVPQKNPGNVLRAFAKIAPDFPEYTLSFCGEGSLRPELEQFVQAHGLQNRVCFYGTLPNVEEKLQKAALYVLCSHYEGMPNALMEAMAVGVPSISTDCPCGGPRELLADCGGGLLIPCDDSDALAEAMARLLSEEDSRREAGQAAARRARQFHPDTVLKEWREYLDQ